MCVQSIAPDLLMVVKSHTNLRMLAGMYPWRKTLASTKVIYLQEWAFLTRCVQIFLA